MEEVIYFNADFEKQLFSQSLTRPASDKLNQELEYLLFFIEPYKTVFTEKEYPKDYLDFIHSITGVKPSTTKTGDLATPWFGNYHQLDLKKKWQNKLEFFQFLEKYQFNLDGSQIISHVDQLENGFLYKRGDQMSGRGHFLYPKDKKGIEKYLNDGGRLLKEPLVKRSFDYSFLFEDGKLISEYINDIDDLFQYKGTNLGVKADISLRLREKIKRFYTLLNKELSSYKEIYSLDSYFFENSKGEMEWIPCELNLRKTMGHIALKLKTLYFPDLPYLTLKISTTKCDHLYKKRGEDFLCLSPLGNKFFIIIIAGKTQVEIQNRQRELLS